MIIALVGESAVGKDYLMKKLVEEYDFISLMSYTTRAPREGEVNGIDYYFITNKEFHDLESKGLFAETDIYSGERYYGSLKEDYIANTNKVKVLTPNGVRQLRKHGVDNLFVVYITTSLDVKCKRYIEREKGLFNTEKLIELTRRTIADSEMFRGFEKEADLCIENKEDTKAEDLVALILDEIKKKEGESV